MLTEELRRKRVDGIKALLKIPETQSHIDFRDVITEDESWIFLNIGPSSIWIEAEELAEFNSSSDKSMLTMFWASKGLFSSTGSRRASHSTELTSVKKLLSRLEPCFKQDGEQIEHHSHCTVWPMPSLTIPSSI
jgi:hypothetical protein